MGWWRAFLDWLKTSFKRPVYVLPTVILSLVPAIAVIAMVGIAVAGVFLGRATSLSILGNTVQIAGVGKENDLPAPVAPKIEKVPDVPPNEPAPEPKPMAPKKPLAKKQPLPTAPVADHGRYEIEVLLQGDFDPEETEDFDGAKLVHRDGKTYRIESRPCGRDDMKMPEVCKRPRNNRPILRSSE